MESTATDRQYSSLEDGEGRERDQTDLVNGSRRCFLNWGRRSWRSCMAGWLVGWPLGIFAAKIAVY